MDEAGFSTRPVRRTTWGRVGRTPVVKIVGRGWSKISAAGALTVSPGGARGTRRRVGQFFRLYPHDIDGPTFADFVRALLREVRGPVMLIWDGLGVHRAPAVKAVLARFKRVQVHRLPSYAPELNPVEPMWGNSKGVQLRGIVPEDRDDLTIETTLAQLLQTEQWMDVQLLHKELGSIRAVVRETGYSRNTVRRMLRSESPPAFGAPTRKSGIDDFKEYLTKRFTEHGLSAERLLGEVRAQGFTGSVYMIRRFLRRLRPLRASAATATVRFETAPGFQAQCDWASCGRHADRSGRTVSVSVLVMVLSFIRRRAGRLSRPARPRRTPRGSQRSSEGSSRRCRGGWPSPSSCSATATTSSRWGTEPSARRWRRPGSNRCSCRTGPPT